MIENIYKKMYVLTPEGSRLSNPQASKRNIFLAPASIPEARGPVKEALVKISNFFYVPKKRYALGRQKS